MARLVGQDSVPAGFASCERSGCGGACGAYPDHGAYLLFGNLSAWYLAGRDSPHRAEAQQTDLFQGEALVALWDIGRLCGSFLFGYQLAGGFAGSIQQLWPHSSESAAAHLDYSSYGRIAQNLLQPIWIAGNNVLAFLAEHSNSYRFYSVDVWIRSLPTFIIALATLILLVVLSWRNGRTYCNTICPVGTILSFFARFSWLKIRFDEDKCKKCGKCTRNCKASCIDFKTMTVDYSRCVVCGDCLEQCKFDSLHYAGPGAGSSRKSSNTSNSRSTSDSSKTSDSVDEGRRSFLVGAALATTAAALAQEKKKVDGGLAVIEDKLEPVRHTPITPPGSLSASNMQKRCTGCQLCVSECPNDVLRPSTDLMKLMQPTMSYERGYCRPECHRCSEVCPAGAIQPITLADKSSTQIGHAVWVKKNCIPVTDGVECGNCERHCPVGAIEMVMLDENDEESVMIPSVNEARCIGCGACENLCPARPFAAIYVEGHEVHKTV